MQVTDEAELSAAIAGSTGPLQIVGGGTRTLAAHGAALGVSGLSGITLYEPGALTMVARAGTPLHEVEAALAAENQRLAFEPFGLGQGVSTIGGVFATNASGPRRVQLGAARDFLLGVRFVDGTGRIVQNGGRVMKNVTGYDLVKLMAGSRGRLGVLSEVSFKVLPMPETEATLILRGAQGVGAMACALGTPYEVSGAAQAPLEGATYLRFEGFEASVRYRTEKVRDLLAGYGTLEVLADADASRRLWERIRDVQGFAERAYVARVSIRPSDFEALSSGLTELFEDACEMMLDWGGGLVWIAADAEALAQLDQGSAAEGAARLHRHLQGFCSKTGGHATLMRAPEGLLGRVSIEQPQAPGLARLTAGLQAQFDPAGRFGTQTSGAAA